MSIKISGLKKSLGGKEVLRGVDLEIMQGETMVVMGGSGCGKSVLLKHIMGLMEPDSGRIWHGEVELTSLDEKGWIGQRRMISMLFQGGALFDSMSVGGNLSFPLVEFTDKKKDEIKRIVAEKLALVGLSGIEDKMPGDLSGGMKKRVALARAIIMEPKVMLYDEPTTGLDPLTSEVINDLIRDLNKRLGVTAIVVTHDMGSAFKVGDRLAMLHEGVIVETGTAEQIRNSSNDLVRRFVRGSCGA